MRVGLAASFTAESLEPHLGVALVDRGHPAPHIVTAPINQIQQATLDPERVFGGDVDRLVVLWRIEDVFASDHERFLAGDDDAVDRIADGAAELGQMVVAAAARGAECTFSLPPLPLDQAIDLQDPPTSLRVTRLHRSVVDAVVAVVDDVSGIDLIDLDALQRHVGVSAFDPAKWMLYRQPFSGEMVAVIASAVATSIDRSLTAGPKVLALDCDGTLWGGIVGEDGLAGIALGADFPGRAHVEFQRACLRLERAGIMLVVVSKNNHEDVLEVFERHDAMVLRPEHISAWRVDWEPKSGSLAAIAAELNVGIDSFVFVDDSPTEIAEVAARAPAVTTLQVPEDVELLPGLLARSGLFRGLRITEADARRTQMMGEERIRRQAAAALTEEEYLASLELVVDYFAPGPEHLARVTQLIGKTNQFNLTTIRRSAAEVAALADSSDHMLRAITVADRFGDYGLVGVAIVATAGDLPQIDSFLMSCRVLGRGVESAFLATLVDELGGGPVEAEYRPTRKNVNVAEFYPDHGFLAAGDGRFALPDGGQIAVPPHVEVRSRC